jgi:hypothetical protein
MKASATVKAHDFRGLRKLAKRLRQRLQAGVVLYDGDGSFGRPLSRGSSVLSVGVNLRLLKMEA